MIERYTRPEMGAIWELQNKYAIWQEIEVAACEAQAELGKIGITREEAAWIAEHASFNKEEVDEIEAVTNHDVIAFLTNMGSYIDADIPEGDPKPSRWVHYGMTIVRSGRHGAVLSGHPGARHHSGRRQAAAARRASAAPSSSRTPCAWAAPTASTPSP